MGLLVYLPAHDVSSSVDGVSQLERVNSSGDMNWYISVWI